MKRIYLDQNKWIDLAAADKGLAKGAAFDDALVLLRAAVAAGAVSLPLSSAHYIETNNRRHWESRRDLAATMVEFSRMHTVAPPDALVPAEVDRALSQFFDSRATPRPLRPFGTGASHAFHRDIPTYRVPEPLVSLVADRRGFERSASQVLELVLLAGLPPEGEAKIPDYNPLSHLQVGEQYARDKQALRETREAADWHKGERAERVAKAQAFTDHQEVINEALELAGLSADVLYSEGIEGMTKFLDAVPTIFASSELERLRHSASQKTWERQDLTDISALSVASVYCDIVVTERVWVDAAQRARLDNKFGTFFLPRLDDLPAHIV